MLGLPPPPSLPPSLPPRPSPAGHDLTEIISKQPQLLWCPDLDARAGRTLSHLLQLHPSGDPLVVAALIAENPDLLFR